MAKNNAVIKVLKQLLKRSKQVNLQTQKDWENFTIFKFLLKAKLSYEAENEKVQYMFNVYSREKTRKNVGNKDKRHKKDRKNTIKNVVEISKNIY